MNAIKKLDFEQMNDSKQLNFIYSCIDTEDLQPLTVRDEIKAVFDEYRGALCPHDFTKYLTPIDRLDNWLRGLPSTCYIPQYRDRVYEIADEWWPGMNEENKDKLFFNWGHVCAFYLIRLAKIFNVNLEGC